MTDTPTNKDPLHGKTLKAILAELVERMGWEELATRIRIKCFAVNPSLKSSLTFLRRTPWARAKVENLYLESIGHVGARRGPVPKPAGCAAKPARKETVQKPDALPAINPWTGKAY